jgi:hypothetical protein
VVNGVEDSLELKEIFFSQIFPSLFSELKDFRPQFSNFRNPIWSEVQLKTSPILWVLDPNDVPFFGK